METSILKTTGNYGTTNYTITSEVDIDKDNKVQPIGIRKIRMVTDKGSIIFNVTEEYIHDNISGEFTFEKFFYAIYTDAQAGSETYKQYVKRHNLDDSDTAKNMYKERVKTYKKLSKIYNHIYYID